jgi:Zn-dependent peptidase ImmA (M78 family)
MPQDSLIILREDIYEGCMLETVVIRMTVAHEIGHLLMHKNIAFAERLQEWKLELSKAANGKLNALVESY